MTWLWAAVSLVLAAPLALSTWELLPRWWGDNAQLFCAGATAGVLLCIALRRWVPVIPTLEHELSHWAAAVLMWRKPLALSVGQDGGHAVYSGRGSTIIRLTPYTVPLTSFLLYPLVHVIRESAAEGFIAVLGASWGYHLWRALSDAGNHQPDLQEGGLLPSWVYVAAMGSVAFAAAALLAVGGPELLLSWGETGWDAGRTLLALGGKLSGWW